MTHLSAQPSLSVRRSDLQDALRRLSRTAKPNKSGDALISYNEGSLEIAIGGAAVSLDATGVWAGQARVPGRWVLAFVSNLPAHDPLTLSVRDNQMFVGSAGLGCEWQMAGAPAAQLPLGADLRCVLAVGMEHDDRSLERAGILKKVQKARDRRERMIERALQALAPLGVSRGQIEALVDAAVPA